MNEIKVSVIVPVYNSEDYLKECLNSLQNQTLKEIEIICVDDGSTDQSCQILDEYAKLDDRFHILHQENLYAGVARNNGLSIAKGQYVVFFDSDDFFDLNLLEKAYLQISSTDSDIVLFGAQKFNTKTREIEEAPWYFNRKYLPDKIVFSRKDIPDKIMSITSSAPWTKMYNRTFILNHGLRFQALQNSNDAYFTLLSMCLAEKITYIDENPVYYRVGQTHNIQNTKSKHPTCFIDAYIKLYNSLAEKKLFPEIEKSYVDTVISGCAFNLNTITDPNARLKIYEAISSDSFLASGILDHPESYYSDQDKMYQVKGCLYAWKEHNILYQNNNDKETHILINGMQNSTPKISVIIPVYNVEQYLEECLNSIITQTFDDIEIICINDGSTDNSLNLLLDYAKRDQRIHVYLQKNVGLSYTRNIGVKAAKGKYIYFMDSDDILNAAALEHLYCKAEDQNLDVTYFDGSGFGDAETCKEQIEQYKNYYHRKGNYRQIQDGASFMEALLQNNEYRTSPCLQFMTRKHFLTNALWFTEGILHEDNFFTFKSMLSAKRVSHLDETLFYRRIRPDSIMTVRPTFSHVYGYFYSYIKMNNYLHSLSLTEAQQIAPVEIIYRVLHNARNQFAKLEEDEKYSFLGLPIYQQTLFKLYITEIDKKSLEAKKTKIVLERTYSQKSELNKKLQKAYKEKSEINRKLQITYKEKSEINRKLQITYKEKAERGIEIKNLKSQLDILKNQSSNSATTKLRNILHSFFK